MTVGENENRKDNNDSSDHRRQSSGGYNNNNGSNYGGYSNQSQSNGEQRPRNAPLEVTVEGNIEKAMKILKRKLIKEGLFKELKMRRYYEKPSEKKKRKVKESLKKVRKEEARNKKNQSLF